MLRSGFGVAVWTIQQVGDDSDAVGTSVNDGETVRPGNPANRHQRLSRKFPCPLDAFEPHHRIRISLAARRKDWADGNVVGIGSVRGTDLVGVVCRDSSQRSGPMICRTAAGERSS